MILFSHLIFGANEIENYYYYCFSYIKLKVTVSLLLKLLCKSCLSAAWFEMGDSDSMRNTLLFYATFKPKESFCLKTHSRN